MRADVAGVSPRRPLRHDGEGVVVVVIPLAVDGGQLRGVSGAEIGIFFIFYEGIHTI